LLNSYKSGYYEKGIFPDLTDPFERNLFNTFNCYLDLENYFPFRLKLNPDEQGTFVETIKLNSGGQVSFSTTKPGITRGNHFHLRKSERFAVIKRKARIQMRRIGASKVLNFEFDGRELAYVDIPVWHTHNITNIGTDDLYTVLWINDSSIPTILIPISKKSNFSLSALPSEPLYSPLTAHLSPLHSLLTPFMYFYSTKSNSDEKIS